MSEVIEIKYIQMKKEKVEKIELAHYDLNSFSEKDEESYMLFDFDEGLITISDLFMQIGYLQYQIRSIESMAIKYMNTNKICRRRYHLLKDFDIAETNEKIKGILIKIEIIQDIIYNLEKIRRLTDQIVTGDFSFKFNKLNISREAYKKTLIQKVKTIQEKLDEKANIDKEKFPYYYDYYIFLETQNLIKTKVR